MRFIRLNFSENFLILFAMEMKGKRNAKTVKYCAICIEADVTNTLEIVQDSFRQTISLEKVNKDFYFTKGKTMETLARDSSPKTKTAVISRYSSLFVFDRRQSMGS